MHIITVYCTKFTRLLLIKHSERRRINPGLSPFTTVSRHAFYNENLAFSWTRYAQKFYAITVGPFVQAIDAGAS